MAGTVVASYLGGQISDDRGEGSGQKEVSL
jgi:hypothetical protein